MSQTPTGARFRAQEFALPSGKKIVASLPGDVATLRRHYSNLTGDDIEVVEHGSDLHIAYLREVSSHHESRRDQIRARFGDAATEWEETHRELARVKAELEKLSRKGSGLEHNFDKYGFAKGVRTYDGVLGGVPDGRAPSGAGLSEPPSHASPNNESDEEEQLYLHRGDSVRLWKRPVIRQWWHRGVIWRAAGQTEVMAIELFFDLLYVGIIELNGEHMAEEATAEELLRFVITFIMSWKIWTEVTYALSWFESDTIVTKLEILTFLATLLGLTTNMINAFNEDPAHNTYVQLVAFYLCSRFLAGFHFAANGFMMPMVRGFMFASCLQILLPTALWIGSIYVEMPYRLALIWIALVLDMWGQIVYFAPIQYTLRFKGDVDNSFTRWVRSAFDYIPAVNIEHRVERTNAFVSLVLGYSVVGILFESNGGYNINCFLGKAILGLMQSFFFNWIYFDIDSNHIDVHAIRRNASAMGVWNNAHLPFIMAFTIASSALSRLVLAADMDSTDPEQLIEKYRITAEEPFGSGVRFFYCHGLAIALLSLTAIAMSHKHHSVGTPRLAKKYRLANRIAMAFIMFFLPMVQLKSLYLISITLGLISWVIVLETWGVSLKGHSFFGEYDFGKHKGHIKGMKEEKTDHLPPVM